MAVGEAAWWARWDSRPEEKAKEPRGRAESERRRRGCEGRLRLRLRLAGGGGVAWLWLAAVGWIAGRETSSVRLCSSARLLIGEALYLLAVFCPRSFTNQSPSPT